MSITSRKYPIPKGFTWSHSLDAYVNDQRWTWHSDTNRLFNHNGVEITPDGSPMVAGSQMLPPLGDLKGESVEDSIQRLGATAPRVTPADIDMAVQSEQFQVIGTLTICVLTMQNGFTVTGESACADPSNFRKEIGERVSRDDAKRKLWPLLGYALKDRLHRGEKS